jgi:bacillithiol system protein YtxJ
MRWENLEAAEDLQHAIQASNAGYVMLFKHSTTCSISHMAKMRLESKWDENVSTQIIPFYLDLKSFRDISNEISERFDVQHESPQVLLIRNEECVYDASHMDISVDELKETMAFEAK